jgi:predicted alpha/beta hydrolase family esterase
MKRVVIVHGWGENPNESWFPWLIKELEAKGFSSIAPQLPDTEEPRIKRWVSSLAQAVGEPDEETYFVGHSMGCQAVARYLESLPEGTTAGGVLYVAGFFKRLTGLTAAEESIAAPWLQTPVDFVKVKSRAPKSIAIFSNDDPFVPLDNQSDFKEKLSSEIIVQHGMKHFNEESGCFELPVALESLLKLAQN